MKILSDNIQFLLLLMLLATGIISCSEDMEELNDDAQVTVDKSVIGVFDINDNGEYIEITERHYADIINGVIENERLTLII